MKKQKWSNIDEWLRSEEFKKSVDRSYLKADETIKWLRKKMKIRIEDIHKPMDI